MFPNLWERVIRYFETFLVAAFREAEQRAEATIAQHLEAGSPAGGASFTQQASLPSPAPAGGPSTATVVLPPVPPLPAAIEAAPPAAPILPPKRPRGRPRKGSPSC
jgi:hypothetical protein